MGDNRKAIIAFEKFIDLSVDPELEKDSKKAIESLRL